MTEKILLLNVHSDRNAGDLALSRMTIQQLQTNFPGCKITLSMNDPQSYQGEYNAVGSFFTWIIKGHRWDYLKIIWLGPATLIPVLIRRFFNITWLGITPKKLRSWLRSYLEADLVVSTAGGFYRSTGKGLTLLLTTYSIALAVFADKPLYIFPQSIGPFKNKWECSIARWLYSQARIVMVRESISVQNLVECGFPKSKCVLLPDVAFGFRGVSSEDAQRWLRALGIDPDDDRPLMGMTVINWAAAMPDFKSQSKYEDAVLTAIRMFITQLHGKVLLLPQTWGPTPAEDDRIISQQLADRMQEFSSSIFAIKEPLTPELLQAVFGEMDVVIGTRMHSNIFSMIRGVPVLPIGYEHKSLGIAEMVGLDEWVFGINEVNGETLSRKLSDLWNQRVEVQKYLKKRIPEIIQESQKAGLLVAQDYALLKNNQDD